MKIDLFLSNITGWNCGIADFDQENDLASLNNFTFAYAKSNISTKYSLIAKKNKFYLADITINLKYNLEYKDTKAISINNFEIAKTDSINSILKISRQSFVYDRFHSDPNFPNYFASEIKSRWLENHFKNLRGDKCFVINEDDQIKGFLLSMIKNDNVIIDLIAVDKRFRNESVATNLINGMINYYKNKFATFFVSTQISNIPSIKLYQKLGFITQHHQLVWHYFK